MYLYELSLALILSLMVVTAVFALCYRYLLISIAVSGIYSLSLVLLFVLLDAVDVAFTEAAVGGGFSLVLFLSTLALIRHAHSRHLQAVTKLHWPALLMVLAFIGLMIYGTYPLPEVGDPSAPAHLYLAPHYLLDSFDEIGIPNVVTSVLASYRGYDTLGEVAVIFCSALGVSCLLTRPSERAPTHRASQTSDGASAHGSAPEPRSSVDQD